MSEKKILPNSEQCKNPIYWMDLKHHAVSSDDIHDYLENTINSKKQAVISYINVHGAILAWKNKSLKDFYHQAELVYCDGEGIQWAMKILVCPKSPKIPLTRWIWPLASFCATKQYRFYLLGAQPECVDQAAKNLMSKIKNLKIQGAQHGYFNHWNEESEKVIQEINEAQVDILLVSFGMPEQEKWIVANRHKLNVPIIMSGGGVIDYLAGKLGKAPAWMIKYHLEWLFRIYEEPSRLLSRYAYDLPLFFLKVLRVALKERLFGANTKSNNRNGF